MKLMTTRSPHFCGLYTPNYARYLRLLKRVSGVWPDPTPPESVDVRALARRALERVSQWRPYEQA